MRLFLSVLIAPVCFAQSVASFDFNPPVVPAGAASVVLTATIVGTPQRVALEPSWAPGTFLDLKLSGNGVYSVPVPLQSLAIQPDDVFRPFLGFLTLFTPSGNTRVNIFVGMAPPDVPRFPITNDGPAMRHTAYVVNMLMPEMFPTAANPSLLPDYSTATKKFYQTFGDDYDVLNVAWVSPSFVQNRDHGIIKNTVRGIGVDLIDTSATYGSKGKLTGVTRFPSQAFFDGAETGMHHEFGHQFINHLNFGLFASGVPHWPFSTMASGVMGFSILPSREGGGFSCLLVPEAAGIRMVPNNLAPVFSNMDMYLLALIPANAVGDNYVLGDQSNFPACNNALYPGTTTKVFAQDVMNGAGGPRVPDVTSSQKQFRLTTILLTRDKLLDDNAMSFYSYFARLAEEAGEVPTHIGFTKQSGKPFSIATQGKASWSLQLVPTMLPQIGYGGVINGASGAATMSPGAYASAYGTGLANTTASADTLPLLTNLRGTTVTVNGRAAPIYFVSPLQVNFQVPFETEPGLVTVWISSNGLPTTIAWVKVAAAAPGILLYGNNHAVAQNQDFSLNQTTVPAAPASFLTVYLTGIGPLDNPVGNGQPALADPLSRATQPYSATIGNVPATVSFLGLTPGFVGLAQANIQVPNLANGDYPLVLRVGGQASNAATVSIGK
jgi:uncharacterized protein (TIGR03437 family)